MPLSADQFAKAVIAAGLSSADEIKTLWNSLPANTRPKDGETFAKLLVEQDKLTQFQAGELLSGSTTPLALGDYVLLAKIGAGGMGQVFKARHRHMERLAAIKLLPPAMTKDTEAVKRFQREVKAAAKLSHPNIVQTYDAGVQRGVWYLVMEFVDGCDLSAVVAQEGPLPIDRAVDFMRQAAKGLAFAHENGVVHRDIKPANLLLDKKGGVKILDMGLARIDENKVTAQEGLTQSGQVMGTVDYMAPEQAFNVSKVDGRADIYSLGCTLYRLLTGRNLFDGESMVEKLMAHQTKPIPKLAALRPDAPAALVSIFEKMVAKLPDDRFPTMAEVETALAALLSSASPQSQVSIPREPDSKLSAFFNSFTGGKPAAAVKPQPVAAPFDGISPTVSLQHAHVTTDPVSERSIQVARENTSGSTTDKSKTKRPLLIGGGLIAVLLLLGIWVIIRDKDGKEVAKIKVPDGGTATVQDNPKGPVLRPANPGVAGDRPQIFPGDIVPTFTGLLNDPPPIPGVKRWNVETRYARGHGDACWSPDGKHIAAVSGRQLRIYTAPDLTLVRILPEHTDWIGEIAWSPDGQWLASVDDTVIRLHNPHTGKAGPVMKGHSKSIGPVAWMAGSKLLVSGADKEPNGEDLFVWSVDGTLLRKLPVPGYNLRLLAHSQKSILAAQDGYGGKGTIWDPESGQRLATFPSRMHGFNWSNDGKSLLVVADLKDPKVLSWDPHRDDSPVETPVKADNGAFRVRPNSDQILAIDYGSISYSLVNSVSSKRGPRFDITGNSFIKFSPDGKWLLTGRGHSMLSGSMQLFSVGEDFASPATVRVEEISRLAWSPTSDVLATDFNADRTERTIGIWNLGPNSRWHSFGNHGKASSSRINTLAWDSAGHRLVSGAASMRVWNPETGIADRTLEEFQNQTNASADSAAYSPDGKWLAVARGGRMIGLFAAANYEFKELLDLTEKGEGCPVQFIGKPPALVVRNKRWNMEKREWEAISVESLQYTPDGEHGIKWKFDGVIDQLKVKATRKIESLPQNRSVTDFYGSNKVRQAWSPDSRYLAAPGSGGLIVIFSQDGKFVRFLTGMNGVATAVEFAPDGLPRLAAVGRDHTLRVWNTETGRQLFCGVQLSPDQAAILNDKGGILFGDSATVERELIYMVEYDDGRTAVLTPTEFRQQFKLPQSPPPVATPSVTKPTALPPPVAKAPFDATQAKTHQAAWAKHLGTQVETTTSVGAKMILIPPSDEVPKSFYIGKYEVTQAEWEKVMGYNPSDFGPKNPKTKGLNTTKFPVEQVSWYDSVEFCNKLSVQEGLKPYYDLKVTKREAKDGKQIVEAEVKVLGGNGYHIPTYAEWTHGCAAGAKTKYHFGDKDEDLLEYAWIKDNSEGRTHVVGEKKTNGFGLHDMHGNLHEWNEEMLTIATTGATERALRGGYYNDPAGACAVSYRSRLGPAICASYYGLRVARSASSESRTPPPLAKAPFDAKQAREHQEAWAKYLGVKIETVNSVGGTMVLIPPGDGMTDAFYLGKFEVTQAEWEKVMGYNPSEFGPNNANVKGLDTSKFPVEKVSWYDSVEFCNKLSVQEGLKPYYDLKVTKREAKDGKQIEKAEVKILGGSGYHIPTDPEWTHGCLAGAKTQYHFGGQHEQLPEYAWFDQNSDGRTHTVGEKKPNAFGLFDIHGNAREWNEELLTNADGGPVRVYRGGAWNFTAANCELRHRHGHGPADRSTNFGLRLARVATVDSTHPPLAKAPFDAAQAKAHQAAWANHLGTQVETVNSVGGTMVLIPPGDGMTDAFYLGKFEVTQAEWEKVMGYNPSYFSPKGDYKNKVESLNTSSFPVENVTWYDCAEFCNRMSLKDGLSPYYAITVTNRNKESITEANVETRGGNGYHIPKREEWSQGCRAGSQSKYHLGDQDADLSETDWYADNSDGRTHNVGEKKANGFGLFDLLGNVQEWVEGVEQSSDGAPLKPHRGSGALYQASECVIDKGRRSGPGKSSFHLGIRLARSIRAERLAPPLAVAPFDATQAKAHQAAWAKHLGTQVETVNSVGAKMILIPPGEFMMGSTDEQVEAALKLAEEENTDPGVKERIQKSERPQHKVVITKPLLMGTTEVTIGQFKQFTAATSYQTEAEQEELKAKAAPPPATAPDQPPPKKPFQSYFNPGYVVTDDSPVTMITWNDAVAYCNWLSTQEKLDPCYRSDGNTWQVLLGKSGYRLPTEAEWEYACRAGTTTQYSFGDDHQQLEQYGWFSKNAGGRSHAVGTKSPNPFGLFDMHGNAQEWCQDRHGEKWYAASPSNDPKGPDSGGNFIIRGGNWIHYVSNCRSAFRHLLMPLARQGTSGFRCVRTLDASATTASVTPAAPLTLDDDVNRRVAAAFLPNEKDLPANPYVVHIQLSDGKRKQLKPGDPLPEEAFEVVEIHALGGSNSKIHAQLGSIAQLRSLEVLRNTHWAIDLKTDELALLARSPSARHLRTIPGRIELKSANIELLKGFPKLEIVEFDGAKSTDDDVVKVTELPASLKEFRVAGLGTRTMPVTRRGWDAIAKLPVTTLYFASPVISSEGFAALGTMQNVEELSLYASGFAETDLAALSSLAKLNQLNLQNTTLTDKAIPNLGDHN